MTGNQPLDIASSAVQHHLTLLQGIIQRMAENSRSCKLWCITIVAAVLVLVARTERPDYALIALLPAILFLLLDTYYLALERGFRCSYDTFVRKLHFGQLKPADLYNLTSTGSAFRNFYRAFFNSFSILPFYLGLAIMVVLVWAVMNCWAMPASGGG